MAFVERIVVHDVTDSTNDDARRLGSEGAPEGTVVVASRQRSGRGRLGRSWESPYGLGLYLSVLFRPAEPPSLMGRYAIAAAVAACAGCRRFSDDRVVLKWPNDVLAGGAKLAGILAEGRQGPSGAELVIGFGVNVHQSADDFPDSLKASATSLRLVGSGAPLHREAVAAELLECLSAAVAKIRTGDWREVAGQFLRYAPDATGRRARLASGTEGLTDGLDDSGALRVATPHGVSLLHASESVTLLGE